MHQSTNREPRRRPVTVTNRVRWGAAALALLMPLAAHGQGAPAWATIGPPGGRITSLLALRAAPSAAWAGTAANGVFVTADAGATWAVGNAGLAPSTSTGRRTLYTVRALASDGAFVYAATDAGLFSSPVASTPVWSPLAGPAAAGPIARLAFDSGSGRLYAASAGADAAAPATVFVGTIAAGPSVSWTASALPVANGTTVASLSVAPPDGSGGAHVIAAVDNHVYTAGVAAASPALAWTDADPAAMLATGSVTAAAFIADVQQTYACSGTTLYVSGNAFDANPVWLPANAPPVGCQAFSSVPIADGGLPQVLLGTSQGSLVSTDGTSFAAISTGAANAGAAAFAMVQEPQGGAWTVLVATATGIGALPAAGAVANATWMPRNGPASVAQGGANARLNSVNVVDVASLDPTLYAACVDDDVVEVQATGDGGATWTATGIAQALQAGETILALEADAANGVLYAATTQGVLAYVAATHRWTQVAPATLDVRASALALGGTAVFAATDRGVYAIPRSAAPSGAVPVAAGLASYTVRALRIANGTLHAAGIDPIDQNWVFVVDEASAAQGTGTWTPFGLTSTGTDRITSLLPVAGNLLAATSGGGLLYASAASAWASANTSADPALQLTDAFGIVNALYTDGTSVYAATGSNGIYVSPVGTTFAWTPFNGTGGTALPTLEVHALRATASAMVAATRAGVAALATSGAGGAPPPPSPSPSSPAPSASGGGALDPLPLLGLLLAVFALRAAARRSTR